MRILFVCPRFHEYHRHIIHALRSRGATTSFIADIGDRSLIARSILKIPWMQSMCLWLIRMRILFTVRFAPINVLFVIRGKAITPGLLKKLKSANIVTIFYSWDSLLNNDISAITKGFDSAFSFDLMDCRKHSEFQYLPLFSCLTPDSEHTPESVDLISIGGIHSDRIAILQQFQRLAYDARLSTFFYLHNPFHYILWQYLFHRESLDWRFIRLRKLSLKKCRQLMLSARCVIDISHPNQAGLTIRSIEALALRRKLITTNDHIIADACFDPAWVNIVRRDAITLDTEFISSRAADSYKGKVLYLDDWLQEIFSRALSKCPLRAPNP